MPYTLQWGMWTECWPIIADGADGKSHRYLVTATNGRASAGGLCSWDLDNADIEALYFHSTRYYPRQPKV